MSKRSNHSRSSSKDPNSLQQIFKSPVIRTPLSDISNANSPAERLKLRKIILDNKRSKKSSSSTNVRNILCENISSLQSSNNNKRSKKSSSSINVPNILSENINSLQSSNNTHRNMYSIGPHTSINETSSLVSTITDNSSKSTPSDDNLRYSISPRINISNNQVVFGSTSTITKLSSGKRKLEHKKRDTTPIPMVNLDSDDDDVLVRVEDPYKGVSKDYLDHGDQVLTCEICSAKLWTSKGGKGRITMNKMCYSMCCGYGKVELPPLKDAHTSYQLLFSSSNEKSKFFQKNIRRYNSMFSFTSMGGKVDSAINKGHAPFIYRISGQNYHCIGSLKPSNGNQPQFCQLYIYDTENEITNRQALFGKTSKPSSSNDKEIDVEMIHYLRDLLDSENMLVKTYRMVRDHFHESPEANLKLRLMYKREKDGRTYSLPTTSEVAALVVGDIDKAIDHRDILVETQSGMLQRISELHPSYLALQYPLLFPYGDDGYRIDIPHRDLIATQKKIKPKCTMREFFSYRIQDRNYGFSLILNGRRLLQQFLVDAYTMIESERLHYIRRQQTKLRSETFENLKKHKDKGKQTLKDTGKPVILPSLFTGGARFMQQNYLDAMALCKSYGYPDFFITITCNPKWPEVKRFLKDSTIKAEDRPDILCRLFKMKFDSIIKDLKDSNYLGEINVVVYTVEFQKRGLPHAHICLFMNVDHKLPTVDHIDPFISAEIPDKNQDPELYSLVSDYMIHGPCGNANLKCPCMVDKRCSKNFPKKFSSHTTVDSNGFPVYRRRDSGHTVIKSGVRLDNRSVVPYNKRLLKRYQAHINVEWCNQSGSVKYLFKYINKGPDMATAVVSGVSNPSIKDKPRDEIKEYYDCRYISACEESWRIFSNEVHYRYPVVMRLPFHMPGQQNVVYGADDDIDNVLSKPSVASSIFVEWMKLNESNENARKLTYVEFPSKFVWKLQDRCWQVRKTYQTVGCIHSVSPALGEPYFLRILLNKVREPRSFEEIRTVNGQLFPTFRDACYAMGLLDDDNEYVEAIKEASFEGHAGYLRALFATLLLSNTLSRPEFVWENTWKYLADDILYRRQKETNISGLVLPEHQVKNLTLLEIEKYLVSNGSSLRGFNTMPFPDDDSLRDATNRLINEELSHDVDEVQTEFNKLHQCLTDEQRAVFDEIMAAVASRKGGLFFVYGYGGTGKTFLWKTLASAVRCRETQLIIWDEAPMVHKHAFEALDRTMSDVFTDGRSIRSDVPFGGKVFVFGDDFRQILPVIPNGTRQQIVCASLSSSYIWSKCKLLRLTKNMRLTIGADSSDMDSIRDFAKWLLDIGEGKLGDDNDGEAIIEIPDDLLITDSSDPIQSLIDFVYPSIMEQFRNPGDAKEYLSSDSICQTEQMLDSFQEGLYSTENLNALKIFGLPNHRLVLKVGVPVMLLRNIDQQKGLCHGTRLKITFLGKRVIEAEVISSGNIGTRVFIPRLNMIPSDKKIPFEFQRRQFPLSFCFAMTINKSQGQSLSKVGLYLKDPVFTHGQLYVALSRVKTREGVKILIFDADGKPTNKTSNVVYKEVFGSL
ncbi:uncharacterized protein LOC110867133 [Helianthus annuus]|uniref:uncharacterized protein LOC110867133 n=1 Tax=Helianthus annuus TaxID=4232 RepID=UPI000B908010|nr:uncharacterized protein LOC110867133 [Helianthus annuus]